MKNVQSKVDFDNIQSTISELYSLTKDDQYPKLFRDRLKLQLIEIKKDIDTTILDIELDF